MLRDAIARDGGNYTHIDSSHYGDLRADDIYDFRGDIHNLHDLKDLHDLHELNELSELSDKLYNIHNKFDDLSI